MAALAGIGTIISAVTGVVGTAMSASATLAAGKQQQQMANYQAKQQEAKGMEERAAAQADAEALKRKKELALSTQQARAAASGFSATDPTNLVIAGDIEKYGTLQEQMASYGGAARQAGYEGQAAMSRMEGAAKRQASRYDAMSTIIGGVGSLASRFNTFAPKPSTYRYG